MDKIEAKVIELLKKVIQRELAFEVTGETNLINDVSIDSLDFLLLFGEICDEYDINVDETEISNIQTVNDIAKKIHIKLNEIAV